MPTTSAFLASLAESLRHHGSFALVSADAVRRCLFPNQAFAAALGTCPIELAGGGRSELRHPR
ncbi:hypothetical protein GAY28_34530, partial [Azospirillum brasilense]|nr:hypothetical protein [Azospirillum brasilense]